jgi:hypothetical protein
MTHNIFAKHCLATSNTAQLYLRIIRIILFREIYLIIGANVTGGAFPTQTSIIESV